MNGRPPGRFDRRRPEQGLRINHRIRVPEIRVILDEEQLGIMPTHEALRLAEEKGLDLVEISPRAFPPVCRIMDFGKYKYEEAKKKQQARKRASTVETKEIKFRPKTEEHDMAFKVKHVRRFLEGGNKVRLAVVFRGASSCSRSSRATHARPRRSSTSRPTAWSSSACRSSSNSSMTNRVTL